MAKQPRIQRQPVTTHFFPVPIAWAESPRASLWIAATYGLVMLGLSLKYHVVGDYGVETDFFWTYVPEAKAILAGQFPIEDFHGPVYQMLLAGFGLFTADFFHSGVTLSVCSSAVTLLFTFEILRKLFQTEVAIVGALLVAVNTVFIQYAYSAGTDMPFNALVTASVFLLLRSETRIWSNVIASAALGALAYLIRYNGVFILVGATAMILLVDLYRLPWKDRMITAGVFLGAFFLIIAPWGIYCLVEKGSFFYNKNYLNIAYEMFAKGKIGWDQYWVKESQNFTSLRQVVFSDFGLFVSTVLRNCVEHAVGDMEKLVGWHIGVFTLLSVPVFLKERPRRLMVAYLVIGLTFFGVLLLVFYGERFSLFLLPVYSAAALAALTWKPLSQFRFWNRIHAGGIVALLLLVWSFKDSVEFNKTNISSGPTEILAIKQWVDIHEGSSLKGKSIVARKPHIAYYLGMRMSGFPYVNTMEELQSAVKSSDASYMYFGLMEAGMRPQFQQLLDPRNAPPWLRPMTYTVVPPAVLYKVDMGSTP